LLICKHSTGYTSCKSARPSRHCSPNSCTKADATIKAEKIVKQGTKGVTGNKEAEIKTRNFQYQHSIEKLDSVMGVLSKYIGTSGAPGYARRLEERLSNLAGSKKTEFVQMMRDIEYLRLEAPRLLLNASGRPLSAEAGHINNIIAGLNAGDTTANTLRALREVKKLYEKSKKENESLIGAGQDGGETPATAAPTEGGPPPKKMPWENDPVVGQ
jgi:hypothetical protein